MLNMACLNRIPGISLLLLGMLVACRCLADGDEQLISVEHNFNYHNEQYILAANLQLQTADNIIRSAVTKSSEARTSKELDSKKLKASDLKQKPLTKSNLAKTEKLAPKRNIRSIKPVGLDELHPTYLFIYFILLTIFTICVIASLWLMKKNIRPIHQLIHRS